MAIRHLMMLALPMLALLFGSVACGSGDEALEDVKVQVSRVGLDGNNVPVLLLQEEDGSRWLPIWIGTAEARSIALEIEERSSPRPNTHDLARAMIQGLEGAVARVVVTDMREGTYYAQLFLKLRDDRIVEIDSRPSDAIAMALRTGAPIFVRAALFDSVDQLVSSPDRADPGQAI